MGKLKDLTGMRFGRLIVIKRAENKITCGGNQKVMWYCNCDCGTKNKVISSELLRNNKVVSCGCWNLEKSKFPKYYLRKEPKYDLSSFEYGIGYMDSGGYFIFDKEDYDLIKGRSWHKHHNYITSSGRLDIDGTENEIYMHRLILGNPDSKYDVDHIKTENKFDNRKSNLRIVTREQNNRNCKIQSNNTSGVTGVRWHTRDKIWESWIRVMYKDIYLGRFKDFDDAVKARKEAEEKYFGEWSYDNSQKKFQN